MNIKTFLVCFLALIATSCVTKKADEPSTLNYMQNIEQIAVQTAMESTQNTIQKGDQLVILVMGKDQAVVRPFNQSYTSGEAIQSSAPGGNKSSSIATASGPTYVVDGEGSIDFPILGKLSTTGKTLDEFKEELRGRLTRYLISPAVSVRLTNYKITVLGEVTRPGEYVMADGKATLLSALGMAGDLTMYGKREDVLLVRNVDGEIIKQRINLTDAEFFNSPYYHLKQGDVIYVSANKSKEVAAKQNPNTGLYISIASVALGLLGLLVTVFKK